MFTNKELGVYLKKIREECKLSLRQVGCQSSVSYSHLSMIENGTRKPTALTLRELAKVYNVDYIDLYEKAGYIDSQECKKFSSNNTNAIYNNINTDGLTKEDIEEIYNFIEFVKNKRKKNSNTKH